MPNIPSADNMQDIRNFSPNAVGSLSPPFNASFVWPSDRVTAVLLFNVERATELVWAF